MRFHRTCCVVALGVLCISLGACGSDDDSSKTSATSMELVPDKANDADISFARSLRAHSEAIVAVAVLGQERGTDQRVKDLAGVIKDSQGDLVTMAQGWLEEWKAPASTGATNSEGQATIARLRSMEAGAAFDRALVEAMISELSAIIPIAQEELTAGSSVSAHDIAERITKEEPGELEEMRGLLAELP